MPQCGAAKRRWGLESYHLLAEARVHDIEDAINSEGGLGDVGGYHALPGPGGRRLENACLHLAGQGGVDRQHNELWHRGPQALHALRQDLACCVDLLGAGQEEQDVPLRLRQVDLEDGDQGGICKGKKVQSDDAQACWGSDHVCFTTQLPAG